jgi:hypothetical protein
MIDIYMFLLIALASFGVVRGLLKGGEALYQYSFLTCVTFAGFILPQALSMYYNIDESKTSRLAQTILMAVLCCGACLIAPPAARKPFRWAYVAIDERRFFFCGILLSVIGYISTQIMNRLSEDFQGQQWTGTITIYHFFALLIIPGFTICIRYALLSGKWYNWSAAAIGGFPLTLSILYAGRREQGMMFLLAIGMSLYFCKKWAPPRLLVVAMIALATMVIPLIGLYREHSMEEGIYAWQDIDLIDGFEKYVSEGKILELRNASYAIEATSETGLYGLGSGYWDRMIFHFFPAQIFGVDAKSALMFDPGGAAQEQRLEALDYVAPTGTTLTGIGDAFREFGYFGSLFYVIMGIFGERLWASAKLSAFAQVAYICCLTSAMKSITHGTEEYFPGIVFYLTFLMLAFYVSRIPRPRSASIPMSAVAKGG